MTREVKKLLDSIENEQNIPMPASPAISTMLGSSLLRNSGLSPSLNQPSSANSTSSMNRMLDDIINRKKNRIAVVGVGGGGCNAINRLSLTTNVTGMVTIAANTDAIHLRKVVSDEKILLGLNLTDGLGAGNDPVIGRAAAEESSDQIRKVVGESDMVFVTAGMGGGTGTGAASVIAKIAKDNGALVVGVCTLPFEMEGKTRARYAMTGLRELYDCSDTVIVIPNEKLMQLVPNLPINLAFEVADEILVRAVRGIVNLIVTAAYVNVDFADIRQVLKQGKASVIGMGEGTGESRIDDALRESLSNSLLDIQIMDCDAALINIAGGEDLSLEEVRKCVQTISQEMSEDAEIIWGTMIDPALGDKIVVTTILSGVSSPYDLSLEEREEVIEELVRDSNIPSIWDD